MNKDRELNVEEHQGHFDLNLVANLINALFLVGKHLSLYDEENKLVEGAAGKFFQLLEQTMAGEPELAIYVAREGFLVDGEFVNSSNANFPKYAYRMFEHGISTVIFSSKISRHDLYTFLQVLFRHPSESWDEGGIAHSIENREVAGISIIEMHEEDFDITDDTAMGKNALKRKSDLWDRFALAMYQNFTGSGGSFDLPEGMEASITVYDVTGRVLKTIEADFVKGYNEVSLEQKEVPVSGVLYYQLDTQGYTTTRKMIVMD